jgi:hypothetical protein
MRKRRAYRNYHFTLAVIVSLLLHSAIAIVVIDLYGRNRSGDPIGDPIDANVEVVNDRATRLTLRETQEIASLRENVLSQRVPTPIPLPRLDIVADSTIN